MSVPERIVTRDNRDLDLAFGIICGVVVSLPVLLLLFGLGWWML